MRSINKQPYYHEVTVLFTATRQLTDAEVKAAIAYIIERKRGVVKGTVELDGSVEAEPGDPADLL